MTDETKNSLMLVLCKGSMGNRLKVDLESFLQFNAQMDHDLRNLVDRWADFATPDSLAEDSRVSRFS